MLDLKALVRELADSLQAIYEPDGSGYAIEVPLKGDRYQSVSLLVDEDELELLTVVHELDKTAQATLDKYRKKVTSCKLSLEAEPEDGVYRACVRAHVPAREATRKSVEPVLLEVAKTGDGIESELTGGDVD